jgi:MSHA biogenesis protein MshM
VVVLIDEAHAMPTETLEEIRLLSNLESNRSKLLQLVLFGQPELNDILARPDMRQLKERITHNFGLEPLVREDISNYLDFRMRAAGYRGPSVFAPPALKLIEQSSLGLTRRINILADKALLAAFSSGSHQIGAKETQAAIRDCEFSDATYGGGRPTGRAWLRWVGAALVVCVLAGAAWLILSRTESAAPALQAAAPAVPVSTVPAPPSANAERATPPATSQQPASPPHAATSPATAEGALPASPPATPPAAVPPLPSPPAAAPPMAGSAPAPATTPPPAPSPAAAGSSSAAGSAATAPTPATRVETPPPPPAKQANPRFGPLTRERLEAGQAWLAQLPDDHWFIQIFATDASQHAEVESLLRRLSSSKSEMNNIHVYFSELSGKPRLGVTYGNYPTRAAATTAIRELSKPLQANKPYPRMIARLR